MSADGNSILPVTQPPNLEIFFNSPLSPILNIHFIRKSCGLFFNLDPQFHNSPSHCDHLLYSSPICCLLTGRPTTTPGLHSPEILTQYPRDPFKASIGSCHCLAQNFTKSFHFFYRKTQSPHNSPQGSRQSGPNCPSCLSPMTLHIATILSLLLCNHIVLLVVFAFASAVLAAWNASPPHISTWLTY